MSKNEILAELPTLQPAELAEVQAKLDELVGTVWLDGGDLSDSDKVALDAALAQYHANPNAGTPWSQVRSELITWARPPFVGKSTPPSLNPFLFPVKPFPKSLSRAPNLNS